MQLTSHFTLEELTRSDTAIKLKLDNIPTAEHKKNLQELAQQILEPLRIAWGSGIKVTSGYRGYNLNARIGGSKTSAHRIGYAADIVPINGKIKEFKSFVKSWLKEKSIAYDQYIDEKKGTAEWIHIAIRNHDKQQRKQNLEIRDTVVRII